VSPTGDANADDDAEVGVELDCRGLLCPLPVIRLAQRLPDVPIGGTVTLLADDPAAATDVPAWCRMRGQELVLALDHRYIIRRLL
jgi:tRNA 2-thiouridine synthesizing protein A